jgi:hypothetical protein
MRQRATLPLTPPCLFAAQFSSRPQPSAPACARIRRRPTLPPFPPCFPDAQFSSTVPAAQLRGALDFLNSEEFAFDDDAFGAPAELLDTAGEQGQADAALMQNCFWDDSCVV